MAAGSRHFDTLLLKPYLSTPLDEGIRAAFAKHALLVSRIVTKTWTDHGRVRDPHIYTGSGGTAFMLFRVSDGVNHPEDLRTCLEITEQCARVAGLMREHPSFVLGQPGIFALGAAAAFEAGERELQDYYLKLFHQAAQMPDLAAHPSTPPSEILYGKAGFLWSVLFLSRHLGESPVPATMTQEIVSAIIEDGRAMARGTEWPLMYEWHGKRYLGAAHGIAGIVHVLLHFPLNDEDLADVRKTLHQLIRTRLPSGNYPTVVGDTNDLRVQWCHGAAGVALTLCTAARRFAQEEDGTIFLQAALDAGEVVWRRGLLRKRGLCHGISGNAYVFLALYKLTGDAKHLQRAYAFGRFLAEKADALVETGEMHPGDRAWSLFEGLAGTACLFLDLADPENAKFPCYEV